MRSSEGVEETSPQGAALSIPLVAVLRELLTEDAHPMERASGRLNQNVEPWPAALLTPT